MYLATSSRIGKQDKPRIIMRGVIGKFRMQEHTSFCHNRFSI